MSTWTQNLFFELGVPVMVEDAHGVVLGINPEGERAYGWCQTELVGRSSSVLVPAGHRELAEELRSRCLDGETVRNVQTLRTTKDGIDRRVQLTMSPIHGDEDFLALASVMAEAEDERAGKIAQTRRSARLARDIPRKDRFLAVLGHELRNSLGALNTGMQLLREASDDRSRDQTYEILDRQVSTLSRLVEDMLEVARLTVNEFSLHRQRIDVRACMQAAADVGRSMANRKSQRLLLSAPEHPVKLEADPVRLTQVLSNLLLNALRYTPEHGSVGLRVFERAQTIEIQCRDTGIGIEPEQAHDLFELFSQGAHHDSSEGHGIGLFLVKEIVERHGGSVAVHSDGHGHGSVFTVRLPKAVSTSARQALR